MADSFHHRSSLKQQNKKFKDASASSKRSVKRVNKGKVAHERSNGSTSTENSGRAERFNAARQIRDAKRVQVLKARRGLGGLAPPPRVVVVLQITKHAPTTQIKQRILASIEKRENEDKLDMDSVDSGPVTVEFGQGQAHQRATVVEAPREVVAFLDLMMVADVLALSFDASEKVDALGDVLLSAARNFSMPHAVLAFMHGIDAVAAPKRTSVTKAWQEQLESLTGREVKIVTEKKEDTAQMVRFLGNSKLGVKNTWQQRSLVLAENVTCIGDLDDDQTPVTLAVTGYLRGRPLSVNQLIHIPSHGTFQMSRIVIHQDPHRAGKEAKDHMASESKDEELVPDPDEQESLETENIPDEMDAEQTWPSPAELLEASRNRQRKVLVPKGTSSYQAAWFVNDEGHPDAAAGSGDESGDDAGSGGGGSAIEEESDNGSDADGGGGGADAATDADGDDDDMTDAGESTAGGGGAGGAGGEEFLARRAQAKDNADFPDEVDTPDGVAARVRFQKYRGLKSLRTSPWDPMENLPRDHARIFHFKSPQASRARAAAVPADAVPAGAYLTVHLAAVPAAVARRALLGRRHPADAADAAPAAGGFAPLVLGGLLKYENKMALMHYGVSRYRDDGDVIKCKDPLVLVCGLRRMEVRPVYSEVAGGGGGGGGSGDKHKLLRYLPAHQACVASAYAPVTWGAAPALLLRRHRSGAATVAACGTAQGPDANRIILKRIVLTGLPFKVRKRKAVIRFMFYDPADIRWFRPVELWTKMGRRGHIRESLGTHGHMKCAFDAPVDHGDTVCMSLYKRVFPPYPAGPADGGGGGAGGGGGGGGAAGAAEAAAGAAAQSC